MNHYCQFCHREFEGPGVRIAGFASAVGCLGCATACRAASGPVVIGGSVEFRQMIAGIVAEVDHDAR